MSETNQLLQNLSTKDKRNITKILPNSWVTLDIESTGLSPKTDKIKIKMRSVRIFTPSVDRSD